MLSLMNRMQLKACTYDELPNAYERGRRLDGIRDSGSPYIIRYGDSLSDRTRQPREAALMIAERLLWSASQGLEDIAIGSFSSWGYIEEFMSIPSNKEWLDPNISAPILGGEITPRNDFLAVISRDLISQIGVSSSGYMIDIGLEGHDGTDRLLTFDPFRVTFSLATDTDRDGVDHMHALASMASNRRGGMIELAREIASYGPVELVTNVDSIQEAVYADNSMPPQIGVRGTVLGVIQGVSEEVICIMTSGGGLREFNDDEVVSLQVHSPYRSHLPAHNQVVDRFTVVTDGNTRSLGFIYRASEMGCLSRVEQLEGQDLPGTVGVYALHVAEYMDASHRVTSLEEAKAAGHLPSLFYVTPVGNEIIVSTCFGGTTPIGPYDVDRPHHAKVDGRKPKDVTLKNHPTPQAAREAHLSVLKERGDLLDGKEIPRILLDEALMYLALSY